LPVDCGHDTDGVSCIGDHRTHVPRAARYVRSFTHIDWGILNGPLFTPDFLSFTSS
jgi:hypothetical protein